MESEEQTKRTEESTFIETSENLFLTFRCPKCYFIPKISLIHEIQDEKKESIAYINYSCPNNHNGNVPLQTFLNTFKYIPENLIKCEEKKDENSFGHTPPYYFCKECNGKFYCELCIENHLTMHKKVISFEQIDTYCINCGQNKQYTKYCLDDNVSYCPYCSSKHKKHNKIDFDDIILDDDVIESVHKKIEESKNYIEKYKNKVNAIIQSLEEEIENLKYCYTKFEEKSRLEIQFAEEILEIYLKKKDEKNLNFQIYYNLIDIQFNEKKLDLPSEIKIPDSILNIEKYLINDKSNILLDGVNIVNMRKKEETEKKIREESKRKAKEESEKNEKKAKEEADKKAAAEKKAKEEAEKKAAAEKKAKEEADKKAAAEKKAKEEADKKAAAEKKAKEEADKKAAAEKKAKEEADKKAAAEKKTKEEADKKSAE